jgi:hypothetical protein
MSFKVALLAQGKNQMERLRIAQEHLKECRDKFATAQSDLIEAERFYNETSKDYMRKYFHPMDDQK